VNLIVNEVTGACDAIEAGLKELTPSLATLSMASVYHGVPSRFRARPRLTAADCESASDAPRATLIAWETLGFAVNTDDESAMIVLRRNRCVMRGEIVEQS
jgi:hypothetical protein